MINYSNNTPLYAWVIPAWSELTHVDHTFVTDYNLYEEKYKSLEEVSLNNRNFWCCYSTFYSIAGTSTNSNGAIGVKKGDLDFSKYLVQPNATQDVVASRGTITTYGIHGVCHQVANQALFSTYVLSASNEVIEDPLTVKDARGSNLSSFFYGTYGTRHEAWQEKVDQYINKTELGSLKGTLMAMAEYDEFVSYLTKLLPNDKQLANKILEFRKEFMLSYESLKPSSGEKLTAEDINNHNQNIFNEVAKLVSKEQFKAIFGVEANTQINLVDSSLVN